MAEVTPDVSELFQRVAVLNLGRRLDRWRHFLHHLPADWPFQPPLRFPAFDGQEEDVPGYWTGGKGAWGCYLSHLAIIKDCLDNDIDSVLIFEDDATFSRRFSTDVRAFLNSLPSDWAYIYLGGQHIQQHLGLPQKVNEWTYRPFNINRTHAYALRGRRMLQRVYDHLQDPESWTSLHHVDHRMGELHKVLESGLYVPKKWLVAQAPGQSNINGMKLPVRAFHGAQWLDDPQVDLRMVAVLGPYSSGTSAVAGMLHQLGISMGGAFQESDEVNDRGSFEAVGLADLCRKFFDEPWLTEQVRPELRTKLLRIWAANRRDYRDHPDKLAGAKHPLL
jgi:hypothetical protein